MANSSVSKIQWNDKLQGLFDEVDSGSLIHIPLGDIDGFPEHPFKVQDDEAMQDLVESIKHHGILTPALARQKEDGRYELISGHRRKRACEIAGLSSMPVTVQNMDRETATIRMVESNLQRETLLPSEKAFAYKMRLEAMNRQGQRTDLTCVQVEHKLENPKSRDVIAEKTNESAAQIRRYIRLTELIPEILQMVDNKEFGFVPSVEISYLNHQEQYDLLKTMESEDRTPSLSQAQRMKSLSQQGRLNIDVIFTIMTEEKPNEKEKFSMPRKSIEAYIPKNLTRDKETEYVVKALEFYQKHLIKQHERSMER